jgi:hypothetical protein
MSSQTVVDRDNRVSGIFRGADTDDVRAACKNSDCVGASSPVETFSLLANEDRLAILNAIVRADDRDDTPVAFSTLRETIDIRDSGRFSYHLQELTGHFLTRSSDGYSLDEDCCDVLIEVIASIDS